MYKFVQDLISKDKYSIKCPYAMTPTRIVVHNTYGDASALKEISYMKSNENNVSFHVAVDDIEVRQGIPFDRNAWHAGDGNGEGNRKGISIEICYSKSGGDRFIQAEKNAAEYIAKLLNDYGWGIDKVTTHQSYAKKYCPHRTLDMGWDRFLNMIKSYMSQSQNPISPTPEDCTQELVWRGIISDMELWNEKSKSDEDIKWLLIKYYPYIIQNGGSVKNPLSIDSIDRAVGILYNQGIITDVKKWEFKASQDADIKWLVMKMADYIN